MSGSSDVQTSVFENVRWGHVSALLGILRDRDLDDEQHIERWYRECATGYADTAALVAGIGLANRDHGRIVRRYSLPPSEAEMAALVLQRIFSSANDYRTEILRYLRQFEIAAGEVRHYADASTRSEQSPVRNFLMELGVVRHREEGDHYIVDPAYIPLYAQAARNCTPSQLASRLGKKEEIGLAAEAAVITLEQRRLGIELANRVEHVSLRNASAGYDILSATIGTSAILPRYIEVKAVSSRSAQFYWTENEVNVASVLRSLYYLYLVPVGEGSELLTGQITVICDPHTVVLDGDDWIVEANIRVCRPKIVASIVAGGAP